jgi:hypothetical protein
MLSKHLRTALAFFALVFLNHLALASKHPFENPELKGVRVMIFTQPVLEIRDLLSCAQVSRFWNRESSQDLVWQHHYEQAVLKYRQKGFTFNLQLYIDHSPMVASIFNQNLTKFGCVVDKNKVMITSFEQGVKTITEIKIPAKKHVCCLFSTLSIRQLEIAPDLGKSALALLKSEDAETQARADEPLVMAELLGDSSALEKQFRDRISTIMFLQLSPQEKSTQMRVLYDKYIALGSIFAAEAKQAQIYAGVILPEGEEG